MGVVFQRRPSRSASGGDSYHGDLRRSSFDWRRESVLRSFTRNSELQRQTSTSARAARRAHVSITLGILVVLSFTAVALDALARSEGVANWLVAADQRVNRINKNRYSYERYFIDFEDRLINEELREADYSAGGVYLIGTSNLKWATRFWELPARQRSLIHNYGMGSFNHAFQFQFIRYLVEHEGLLKAGGDKTFVVFGVTYHAAGTVYDPQGFFPNLWGRHGLYEYDRVAGITPRPATELWRQIHFKRVRIAGCLENIASTFAHLLGYHLEERRHDHDRYNTERKDWMGPSWKEKIRRRCGVRRHDQLSLGSRCED